MKKLWIYVSYSEAGIDAMSAALLARAQVLAKESNMELNAVIAGEGCGKIAADLAKKGIPTVYYADVPGLCPCEHERISALLHALVEEHNPEIFLFPASDSASLVASALGVILHTGVNVHCVTADIRDGIFVGSVPAFGGQVMSEILCPVKKPQMATVRLSGGKLMDSEAGATVSFAQEAPTIDGVELISCKAEERSGTALGDASLVLCGGAGLGDHEGWLLLQRLAEKLGAAVGCTRDALDLDIGPDSSEMIGMSGCTVTPKVYLGFGVSGAAHHLFGMKDSGLVINVNNDKANLFFPASDYGFVGDAKEIMISLLKKLS